LETKLSNEKIFDAFRMYLYKKVIVIKIDVDEPKDVAMAFEVINDRGIPLKTYVRRILESVNAGLFLTISLSIAFFNELFASSAFGLVPIDQETISPS